MMRGDLTIFDPHYATEGRYSPQHFAFRDVMIGREGESQIGIFDPFPLPGARA